MNESPLPRFVGTRLIEHLATMPAVVVTGARQTGKSTLAREFTPGSRAYFTLDDMDVLDIAIKSPDALTGGDQPRTIDEIQRAPDLLRAVKRAIDRKREKGRFLLTGSANLLLSKRVSESLAGRASYLTLWPMARNEQRGEGRAGRWGDLLEARDDAWIDVLGAGKAKDLSADWRELASRGGFPTPATELKSKSQRAIWFEGYVRTYLERDLQELSSISALPDFRRLMKAASLRVGQMLNQTELGRDVALPQPTVHRYLNLLEASYLLVRLPAFAVNRTKRLIKSPKLYFSDTGIALHLSGEPPQSGAHLENIVLHDLLVWRDGSDDRADLHYWRTATGEEVDFVVERGDELLPIEVKATSKPTLGDARHLLSFREEYGRRSRAGLLLHAGDALQWLAPGILATPWWRVF